MVAAKRVTGGDVIQLLTMPQGPLWKERALIAIRAENTARKEIQRNEQAKILGRSKR